MAEATRLAFGYCFRPLNLADIEQEQRVLKSYLNSELSYTPLDDVDKTAALFTVAIGYFGPCFAHWLALNSEGPRAGLSRHIRLWLKGDITDRAVFHALARDVSLLASGTDGLLSERARVQVTLPQLYTGDDNGNEGMLNLFTLLGPGWVAKLLLSLDGKV